ncbi:MAG: hypothetical protein PHH00_01980 [Candidatus Nanoarchaeia archaeon]|nr:hypothetical protein [Candidatus Nanoarchaeia archaeon]
MKYLFILGRNIELSIAEIKSFLKRYDIPFKEIGLTGNGLLIETDKKLTNTIDKLGGVISIGEVLASGSLKNIANELNKINLYGVSGNKLNYILHDFEGKETDEISSYLKKRFRGEGLKATEKKPTGNIRLQEGNIVKKTTSKLIDEEYFAFGDNFGRITEKSDYEKIEERDMKKPVRRNELSISPRLAKILINLSEVREGETLLDPFCGIGVILEEALLQNIRVKGIDRDKNAIANAKTNMKWFGFDENSYRLINDDSSKIKIHGVDGIATEPELGELQKSIPDIDKARQIIHNFEELIIRVFNNLKQSVTGKIAFTAPLILTGKNRIACDFERISLKTGLKLILVIPEFRESSIVGRSVVVMGK